MPMSSGTIAAKGRRAGRAPGSSGSAGPASSPRASSTPSSGSSRQGRAGRPRGEPRPPGSAGCDRAAAVRQGAARPARPRSRRLRALAARPGPPRPRQRGRGSRRGSRSAAARSPGPAGTGSSAALTFERVFERSSGGSSNEQQTTAGVFDLPLGRYLVYAAGLAFLGAAAFNGYRAVTCKFNKKLKTGEMNDAEEAAATGVGILGPPRADGRLRAGRRLPPPRRVGVRPEEGARARRRAARALAAAYGGLLLGAVAVGLLAYALYCFVQARYRRI